ncbi:hypothetical protein GCM10022243_17780 [Saccharothrix violaceirubra]|uniref:Uncharacterized protein n=1 Tax=Saccharothrix violaceirubra TaxID=413306 RepID=A0A7W7T0Q4_9PSEU|nr:hypothetical protein [Saccharothrix violaceirubra]MBB4964431.1 hypothetical protein [Saccharothrix violaceirubra]
MDGSDVELRVATRTACPPTVRAVAAHSEPAVDPAHAVCPVCGFPRAHLRSRAVTRPGRPSLPWRVAVTDGRDLPHVESRCRA